MSRIGAQPRLASEEEKHGSWKGGMMNRLSALARVYLVAVTALVGVATVGIAIWCLIDPTSFADVVQFHAHQHFLHDVGAFQLGLGVMLLLALIWGDALATALAGFVVANTVHTVNHVMDLDLGGSVGQAWLLGVVSVALVVAFVVRLRQLGYVLGSVTTATNQTLAAFVRQKTIRLTTFRKDGATGSSPVSIVVDGNRAYFRSFERSIKVRRIRSNPSVEFGPATASGTPTGSAQPGSVRLLEGAEYRNAGRLLRQKYPFLHGVLVPMAHRLMRSKFGRTVHAELIPSSSSDSRGRPLGRSAAHSSFG
jgi:PPOX class probable F420-dependent enzyme